MAAVHARLAAQAPTALAPIKKGNSKFTVSMFMQHCVLPRVAYSPQVCTPPAPCRLYVMMHTLMANTPVGSREARVGLEDSFWFGCPF